MKYRITVGVEIDIDPQEHETATFTDLMNAFREGLRINPRIASRVQSLRLMQCQLIEPERERRQMTLLTEEVKSNDR